MDIQVNNANKEVVKGIQLYTGVHTFNVVAVNPDMAALKALGYQPQQEPAYIKEGEEGQKIRIDFYLKAVNPDIRTKASYWLENKPRTNQAGDKTQFINKYGLTTWVKNKEDGSFGEPVATDRFSLEGVRPALIGEEDLHKFIHGIANIELGVNKCQLSNPETIVAGDIKQLIDVANMCKNNPVRLLVGVNDGKYQVVYTKYIGRVYEKNNMKFKNSLEGDYGAFKNADYQNDLNLRVYEAKLASPDTQDGGSSSAPNGGQALVF